MSIDPTQHLATVIADQIKQYPITSDWRTTAGHFGATEHTIAQAIIAAGWVGPEEHAEYVAMEGRFSELLCDLTDGLLSKTGYDVRAMVQQVEETFGKYAEADRKPLEDKVARAEALAAEWISWANGGTDRSWSRAADYGEEFGRELRERIADGDDEPPALEAS
jgi:hypothetical protein